MTRCQSRQRSATMGGRRLAAPGPARSSEEQGRPGWTGDPQFSRSLEMPRDGQADVAGGRKAHPLRGLLVAQSLGAFNDNAWKQIVALLAVTTAASATGAQER